MLRSNEEAKYNHCHVFFILLKEKRNKKHIVKHSENMVYITSGFTESVSIELLIQDQKQTDSTVQLKFTVSSWLKSKWIQENETARIKNKKRCNELAF